MDARPTSPSNNPPSVPHTAHPHSRRAFSYSGNEGRHRPARIDRKTGAALRREHSDGEVVGADPNVRIGPREYQNALMSSERTQNPMARRDDAGVDVSRLPSERRRDVAAGIRTMRDEIRNDHVRRRSLDHQSSRGPGEPRMGAAAPHYNHSLSTAPSRPVNPFTSTDLNRPLPRRPSREHLPDRRSREIILPRWQPDAEVNECPICHTTFGFWFRKHHCRKCGRVVCANCSPHRITIPRQFIVHPPEENTTSSDSPNNDGPQIIDLTGDEEIPSASPSNGERPRTADYRIDPALGGGQEVRLCNPCVPDPNPLPPPSYYVPHQSSNPMAVPSEASSGRRHPSQHDHAISPSISSSMRHRSLSGRAQQWNNQLDSVPNMRLPSRPVMPLETTVSSRRHSHQPTALPSSNNLPLVYGSAPNQLAEDLLLDSLIPRRRSSNHPRHRHHASISGPPVGHSHPYWSEEHDTSTHRSVPQPQLREEDECPICHGALPPKGADGSETAREAHVSTCIETHFSTSGPRASQPHPSTAVDAAVSASTATPSQAGGATMDNEAPRSSFNDRPSSTLFQQRRRTTGMVVYHATEKDCVGEDGGEAECVICFEEFSVGDEMGRLECLCKFHKVTPSSPPPYLLMIE